MITMILSSADDSGTGSAALLVGLAIAAVLVVYFVPLIVAATRHVPNVGSIAVINVFLGWSLVGWVIALAMAARSIPQAPAPAAEVSLPPPIRPTASTPLDSHQGDPSFREVGYDTMEWPEDILTNVQAALDRRGIAFAMEDGELVVDKTFEAFVDRVVLAMTGELPSAADTSDPGTQRTEGGST